MKGGCRLNNLLRKIWDLMNLILKRELLRGIRVAKFYRPSPIQEKVIPIIPDGYDLIAEAETGTGKTAGFGLPIN